MWKRAAVVGTLVVLLHLLVLHAHGSAHALLGIRLPYRWQPFFVRYVIVYAPVLAAVLLWTPARRLGAWLLLAAMLGSLCFGVFFHFVAPGRDNVFEAPAGTALPLFRVTAVVLALVEAFGCWVGLRAARAFSAPSSSDPPPAPGG